MSQAKGNRYHVLGELKVTTSDGASHHVAGRQGAVLAILLSAHPDSVTSERLVEEIWPDRPNTPDTTLHSVTSRLRRLIGDDLITTPGGYGLRPGSIDAAEFESSIADANRSGKLEDYERARGLWTGEPYKTHEDIASVALEIERLQLLRQRSDTTRLELTINSGRAEDAVPELALAVKSDPFNEATLGLYMRALNASGRKREALTAFQRYSQTLADETGLEPSVSIRELELGILVDELDIAPAPSRPPSPLEISLEFVEIARGQSVAMGRTGTGPPLVVHPGWLSKLDVIGAGLDFRAPFWSMLASSHELIFFDRFGTGLSGGVPTSTDLRDSVEEFKAVLRSTGPQPKPIWGASGAGPIVIQTAAEAPELISHLILFGTYASGPSIFPKAVSESMVALVRASWGMGSDVLAALLFPGGTAEMRQAFGTFQRSAAPAELASAFLEQLYTADVSHLLEQIDIPTLVIHYQGDKAVPISGGEQLAREIPGSRYLPLEGITHYPTPGDFDRLTFEIDHFLGMSEK